MKQEKLYLLQLCLVSVLETISAILINIFDLMKAISGGASGKGNLDSPRRSKQILKSSKRNRQNYRGDDDDDDDDDDDEIDLEKSSRRFSKSGKGKSRHPRLEVVPVREKRSAAKPVTSFLNVNLQDKLTDFAKQGQAIYNDVYRRAKVNYTYCISKCCLSNYNQY